MQGERRQGAGGVRRLWRRLAFAVNGSATRPERRNYLQRVFRYLRRLSDAYATHQCSVMACACAYCALLSLVPLLALGISALGFWVGEPKAALKMILENLTHYTPSPSFVQDLQVLLENIIADRKLFGLFGAIGLFWAAHQTFMTMMPAFNLILVVSEQRHWTRQRLLAFGATLLSLVMGLGDLYLTQGYFALVGRFEPLVNERFFFWLSLIGTLLLQVAWMAALFAALYRLLPARVLPWKPIWLGAVTASVLWQLTKLFYTTYLLRVPVNGYTLLYGSLGSLVVFVVWTYVSMGLLLLGAEIAADYEAMRHSLREAQERAYSGADLAAANGVPHAPPEPTQETAPFTAS